MKGVPFCLTTLIASFIGLASPMTLKGINAPAETSMNFPHQRRESAKSDKPQTGSEKEIPDVAGKTLVFLCRSSCPSGENGFASTRKENISRCDILLGKLSGNSQDFKEVLKHCSKCPCDAKVKDLDQETGKISQTNFQEAESKRSRKSVPNRRSSYSPLTSSRLIFPNDHSQSLSYSQKYNPRSKTSESGFVPIPGPYGFKPSKTRYPRLGQYRSESYDDSVDRDYHESNYDEEDVLGSGHFEILKGGVFSYERDNNLGNGDRIGYSSDYNYVSKDSRAADRVFNFNFPYSFEEVLPTEKKSVLALPTNGRDALSRLFAVTADLDADD